MGISLNQKIEVTVVLLWSEFFYKFSVEEGEFFFANEAGRVDTPRCDDTVLDTSTVATGAYQAGKYVMRAAVRKNAEAHVVQR